MWFEPQTETRPYTESDVEAFLFERGLAYAWLEVDASSFGPPFRAQRRVICTRHARHIVASLLCSVHATGGFRDGCI
jgi:hypothetical protein